MTAPKYKHPETGEERTAKEWAKIRGISVATFHQLRRRHGEDNMKAWTDGAWTNKSEGTDEWNSLGNNIRRVPFTPGTWESQNIR